MPPKVTDPECYIDVDAALASGLNEDGLLRLKAVDETVRLFTPENRTFTVEQIEKIYNSFYNFYVKAKELH